MTKNIKFVITRFVFSSSKCTKIRFRRGPLGELTTLPQTLVGWGGDTSSPFPSPVVAYGVSNSASMAPRFSGLLNTKSWPRQWLILLHFGI